MEIIQPLTYTQLATVIRGYIKCTPSSDINEVGQYYSLAAYIQGLVDCGYIVRRNPVGIPPNPTVITVNPTLQVWNVTMFELDTEGNIINQVNGGSIEISYDDIEDDGKVLRALIAHEIFDDQCKPVDYCFDRYGLSGIHIDTFNGTPVAYLQRDSRW